MVGALLLGLYDGRASGGLQHVGMVASFSVARRRELLDEIAPYRIGCLDGHPWAGWAKGAGPDRMPGGTPSRWRHNRELSWQPLRPELVVEVPTTTRRARGFGTGHSSYASGRTARRAPARTPSSYDLVEILGG